MERAVEYDAANVGGDRIFGVGNVNMFYLLAVDERYVIQQ